MTPERRRQIDDLLAAANVLEPAQREAWLQRACGDDDNLWAEVSRFLTSEERAGSDGFPTPLVSGSMPADQTSSWPDRRDDSPSGGSEPVGHHAAAGLSDTSCFFPKAAIAAGNDAGHSSATVSVVRRDCSNCRLFTS